MRIAVAAIVLLVAVGAAQAFWLFDSNPSQDTKVNAQHEQERHPKHVVKRQDESDGSFWPNENDDDEEEEDDDHVIEKRDLGEDGEDDDDDEDEEEVETEHSVKKRSIDNKDELDDEEDDEDLDEDDKEDDE